MQSSNMDASVPAARCYYRAAAELIQESLDGNASPNGEAEVGSHQHKQLVKAVTSFIRCISSWAHMEFDLRLVSRLCNLPFRVAVSSNWAYMQFNLRLVSVYFHPNFLGHPEKYIPANPMSTPAHAYHFAVCHSGLLCIFMHKQWGHGCT